MVLQGRAVVITALVVVALATSHLAAADPLVTVGLPDLRIAKEFDNAERKVIRYEHGTNHYFYVLPVQSNKQVPLRVVLHHAGGSGDRVLKEAFATKHRHQYGSPDHAILYLDCRDGKKNGEWWWGWHDIKAHKSTYTNTLQRTEQRVLDSIEYVVQTYNIDRNRIYLSGRSMGGTGSLGIGYTRGDLFAAILVNVPAGADHFLYRVNNSRGFPDPPPTINTSSQTDSWSKGQEDLLAYCQNNKLPMIFAWGPFGHASKPDMANRAAYDFPWLSIVKNAAYPVFTQCSTDDTYPGFQNKEGTQRGQISAYYRWTNITDTAKGFTMELRLVTNDELGAAEELPNESTADVTLRRIQHFKLGPGEKTSWVLNRDGKTVQKGKTMVSKNGRVTIPALTITAAPAQLTLK